MAGRQKPSGPQVFGEMQSAADAHGNAHLPYCMLQWFSPHGTPSFEHWKAAGPGTTI
jgi:hypothetical protein